MVVLLFYMLFVSECSTCRGKEQADVLLCLAAWCFCGSFFYRMCDGLLIFRTVSDASETPKKQSPTHIQNLIFYPQLVADRPVSCRQTLSHLEDGVPYL